MTYKKSRQDMQNIEVFKQDLSIIYDYDIYLLMDKNSFKPLCYGYDNDNKPFWVYQDIILRNVLGERISADKIIIRDDLSFIASEPLSIILECKNEILVKGKYKNGNSFKVFCRLFTRDDITKFTKSKEVYKQYADELDEE